MVHLPERDRHYLSECGLAWQLYEESSGVCVVFSSVDVARGGFTPPATDVMIRIPAQYPMSPLDMWYCDPPIRVATTGQFAPASEVRERHLGRDWQRFSRHLSGGWAPATDGLKSFMTLLRRELQGIGR